MKYEEVKLICESNGYKSRKDRYKIMEEYFEIPGKTIKDIISFDRYLRDILDVDEVGEMMEKEWHKTPDTWGFNQESKRLLKDKLLYG